jgi:hypothetical protein
VAFDYGSLAVVYLFFKIKRVVRGGLNGFASDIEVGDVLVLVLVGLGYGVVAGIAGGFIVGKDWRADGEGGDGGGGLITKTQNTTSLINRFLQDSNNRFE